MKTDGNKKYFNAKEKAEAFNDAYKKVSNIDTTNYLTFSTSQKEDYLTSESRKNTQRRDLKILTYLRLQDQIE